MWPVEKTSISFSRGKGTDRSFTSQRVPEKKTAKTRVHLDIAVENLDTAVARAVALGAKKVQPFLKEGAHSWVVMEDPDGNEFCLTQD